MEGERKWLEFEFFCRSSKTEEALEVLHDLGHRPNILDCTIGSVIARWSEIINGNTGGKERIGTHISGVCHEDQQEIIVDAIFGIDAVEHGDRYLNQIRFIDPSTRRRFGGVVVEGLDYY